jgi:hypothetical protein
MSKIFVSCGQFTDAEKSLGKAIVRMIREITGADAFFAETVQDLNGLDANILGALRDCSAFITVLHPRGTIVRPDQSIHIRASVWIEQEIAVATYIQRVEKRALPVIAFIHRSVGREGIRDLLHLNPIPFSEEAEILAALPELLQRWKALPSTGFRLLLESGGRTREQEHWIRRLAVRLANESGQRISSFNCLVRLPAGILRHWSAVYPSEVPSDDQRYRCFSFDETFKRSAISPRTTTELINFPYCTACAGEHTGESSAIAGALVGESEVQATVWIDGREYSAVNTIRGLSADAEARGV